MNILPKKNWHVRKKENIARVRRDEAEAAEKEKEIERRAKLAEQESRIAILRKRAREDFDNEDDQTSLPKKVPRIEADIYTSAGNINFFKDHEAGDVKTGTNKEYEADKKAEKEAYEKKIGLLTYLGQDSLEATGKPSWFMERDHTITSLDKRGGDDIGSEVGLKSKLKVDPLKEILKHSHGSTYSKSENSYSIAQNSKPMNMTEKCVRSKSKNLCRKDKKHKKERHKRKKKKHNCNSDSNADSIKRKKNKKHSNKKSKKTRHNSSEDEEEKQKVLAKLREERLKREAKERKREQRLLDGKDPDGSDGEETKKNSSIKQMYNSQFHPHLAKQNQSHVNNQISTLQPGVKYWLN